MAQKQPDVLWLNRHKNSIKTVEIFLSDFLLAEIYSPIVLTLMKEKWEALPFYVQKSIPSEILEIASTKGTENIQTQLNQYWLNRAIQVLSGYQNCPIPLTKDKRINGPRRNLLSSKGEKQLAFLKQAQARQRMSSRIMEMALESAHKFLLNLDLFIGFDYLNSFEFNKEYKDTRSSRAPTLQVIMTSGCYNGCVHCGYSATAPVYHMPYPLFLKLFKTVYSQKSMDNYFFPFIYGNSDPVSYQDSIINADSGDVMLAFKRLYSKPINISFLTKGILIKKDEVSLAKVLHHTKDKSKVELGFLFSFVDLPGENVNKNLVRLKRTQEIFNSILPGKMSIRHYAVDGMETFDSKFISQFGKVDRDIMLDQIGRWAEVSERLQIEEENYHKKYDTRHFTMDKYIIAADLTLYDVYKKGNQFFWQPICSILDQEAIGQMRTASRIHPTVLGKKVKKTPLPKKSGWIMQLYNQFLNY